MKQIMKLLFGVVFFWTCVAQADLYTIQNVEMSGVGATPVEAKNNAIKSGELLGFTQLVRSLIGTQDENFLERPTDDEILEMVRDISILEEKNTATSYWGKMNVRFKEASIQNLLKKNNLAYLKKAPPVYWVIPIWQQGGDRWTLEDENPLYQALKSQYPLSESFQMVLPNGDVKELISVEQSLENQDFSFMSDLVAASKAERPLVIEVYYALDESWTMSPKSYAGTETLFDGLSVQGIGKESVLEGWQRLNLKMAARWQEKYRMQDNAAQTYYARFNLDRLVDWKTVKRDLSKLTFLDNVTLQGAMPGQILLSFTYADGLEALITQLDKSGFTWLVDTESLGTLKRKDFYEDAL